MKKGLANLGKGEMKTNGVRPLSKKDGDPLMIRKFFQDCRHELDKVMWPERSLVVRATTTILAIVIFSVAAVSFFDVLWSRFFFMLKAQI